MSRDEILLKKLVDAYHKFGKIVIGVDFDDTIFPYTQYENADDNVAAALRARQVRTLLEKAKPYSIQCLWTVANEWSLIYKKFICIEHYGMEFDYYNESPITQDETVRKPHFNLLLDDCAGLESSLSVLKRFIDYVNDK